VQDFGIDVVGEQLAVHMRFADAARDQLRVLRAEVEDGDEFLHAGSGGGRSFPSGSAQVVALPCGRPSRSSTLIILSARWAPECAS
jgi:hypothetical protein